MGASVATKKQKLAQSSDKTKLDPRAGKRSDAMPDKREKAERKGQKTKRHKPVARG
jgi:hypothetical protein